ncbi:MAG TPA: orotidine-5'-phosphate decarboxylase [Micromonosporaceae bacterium]|jgi:orotidine-5'-phosphate decarboxylase|nr:orotidine-5'-phosphate decarboxylase [Micromonosporaceae bacterium]
MDNFGVRLRRAVAERGQLCIGIDPHPQLLRAWGLSDDISGLVRFTETATEALGSRVAVAKPQSAFFERFGSRGIGVLESTIRQLRDAGALVVLDVKRGDIGSTVAAYAEAYLDPSSSLYVDAITANPYLGVGSLRPMIDTATAYGGGVFIVALTSNPEAAAIQRLAGADGRTVGQLVLDEIAQLNHGMQPLGDVGAVIGATIEPGGYDLSRVNGPLLAPGLGAQGGAPGQLRAIFGDAISNVLPSYSREVLAHGPSVTGLRDAAARALDACRAVLDPTT